MTGDELIRLEEGDRAQLANLCENITTRNGRPMRWASHRLTGAANYVSTLAIYARYPIRLGGPHRGVACYQRRYLLDGRTRTWGIP